MQDTAVGLLAGGAALGLLATMWSKIKGVAWRVIGLLVQRVEIPTEAAHEAVIAYLIANYRRSRNYDRMYGASWEYQRDGRYGLVPYESLRQPHAHLLERLVPVPLHQPGREEGRDRGKGKQRLVRQRRRRSTRRITFLRGTLDVEKILATPATRATTSPGRSRTEQSRDEEPLLHPPRPRPRRATTTSTAAAATAWRGISRATTACSRTRRTSSARPARTTARRSTT